MWLTRAFLMLAIATAVACSTPTPPEPPPPLPCECPTGCARLDYNGDGIIGGPDFTEWRKAWNVCFGSEPEE